MSGSSLLLAELAADLRCYLVQEGKSSLLGSTELAALFPKQKKTVSQQTPAFLPSARPKAAPHLPLTKPVFETVTTPQPKPVLQPQPVLQPKPVSRPAVQPKAPSPAPVTFHEEAKVASQLKTAPVPQLKKYLAENASSLSFIEQVPEDAEARKVRSHWLLEQMTVALLIPTHGEEEEERFIQAVAKGISERLSPAYFPDRELPPHYLPWEELLSNPALRLILTTRAFLLSDPSLRKGCSGTIQEPLLFGKPLLILDPLTHYLSSPKQKGELWEKIKRAFLQNSPQSHRAH